MKDKVILQVEDSQRDDELAECRTGALEEAP